MQIFQPTISRLKRQNGFTLIELVVVMAIIAVFVTLSIPRMRDKMDLHLKKRARMLSATMTYVYNQAAFKNSTYRIHYDLEKETYWIESAQGMVELKKQREDSRRSTFDKPKKTTSAFQVNTDVIKKPIKLEKGIKFKSIKTQASPDPITSGEAFTHFFPSGYAEKTTIIIENKKGRAFSIVINPLTGKAKVYDYDINDKDRF